MKKVQLLFLGIIFLTGCNKDDISIITDRFDPVFAAELEKRGYIEDASDITMEEVKNITKLDVSGTLNSMGTLSSLRGIEYFESLDTLNCDNNQLTSLDVTKNTALTFLNCYGNQLTFLDVSKNTALTRLSCDHNPGQEGVFVVKSWFDNSSVPSTDFTTDSWDYEGNSVEIQYTKVE